MPHQTSCSFNSGLFGKNLMVVPKKDEPRAARGGTPAGDTEVNW